MKSCITFEMLIQIKALKKLLSSVFNKETIKKLKKEKLNFLPFKSGMKNLKFKENTLIIIIKKILY